MWAPRDRADARREARGRRSFRADALTRWWGDRFQCSMRPDPAPLRFFVGSAGSGRCSQGSSGKEELSR
jgi:hypothetical protein